VQTSKLFDNCSAAAACVRMQVVCDVCRVRAGGTACVLASHTQCVLHKVCTTLLVCSRCNHWQCKPGGGGSKDIALTFG
jgi:hypothetical protein